MENNPSYELGKTLGYIFCFVLIGAILLYGGIKDILKSRKKGEKNEKQ